ncbi:hypothetical protein GCM10017771_08350 [Streptomyces capitiformicae]|uniref:Uncharacterized protein n=1 Tax=Streptomyces capitiformicae TaxID=2014920 RepID=A0A919GF64_9ACTN|nr:hypothetical protein GCM10017771_08350 [Streptomyces capitiformicae]
MAPFREGSSARAPALTAEYRLFLAATGGDMSVFGSPDRLAGFGGVDPGCGKQAGPPWSRAEALRRRQPLPEPIR